MLIQQLTIEAWNSNACLRSLTWGPGSLLLISLVGLLGNAMCTGSCWPSVEGLCGHGDAHMNGSSTGSILLIGKHQGCFSCRLALRVWQCGAALGKKSIMFVYLSGWLVFAFQHNSFINFMTCQNENQRAIVCVCVCVCVRRGREGWGERKHKK